MKILADGALPHVSQLFHAPFQLTCYHTLTELHGLIAHHDVLICRSTLKVNEALLANSPIRFVATASSGTDHIDLAYLEKQHITLFDAKGSNTQAVADYVLATLAVLSQLKPITGRLAGVIGVGEVGTCVARRLHALGFDVLQVDPPKAMRDPSFTGHALADLTNCDLLCIHANLHLTPPYPSVQLISNDFLSQLKPGTTLINAARGGIVDEEALLNIQQPLTYCTDVFVGEPAIQTSVVEFATLCTPHIAGHSIEAKERAVLQISQQIHALLGLPMPTLKQPYASLPLPNKNLDWQSVLLSLYNPLSETLLLKAAADKTHAFLTQRQAHQSRHDFLSYALPKAIQALLEK